MKLNQTLKDCIFKVKHYSKQIAIYLPLRVSLRNAVEYHRPWMSILRPGPRTGLKSRAEAVVAELPAARLNKAADPVEEKIGETLGCFSFPESRWRKVRTNNPLERLMKEIRRRSRVVWGLSRWSILSLPGCGQVETRRRHTVEHAKVYGHGAAARDETST